ncbi:putative reverse transcriptase zinc-binding domain-containing protein [Helianthus annuus]|nr:putative reverse transcriptase zinc-binding domain-containing protein [Helianthus annuus]
MLVLNKYISGCWKPIVKQCDVQLDNGKCLNNFVKAKVGDGKQVSFWFDIWNGNIAFKDLWPHLFLLEKDKRCRVADRISFSGQSLEPRWRWSRLPTNVQEIGEFQGCSTMIAGTNLQDRKDSWVWDGLLKNDFSVKAVKKEIADGRGNDEFKMKWIHWVPLKCNIHAWRAEMHRLPTRIELEKRNIVLETNECVLCSDGLDSTLHIFTACAFALEVWCRIGSWCKLPPIFAFEVRDLLSIYKTTSGGKQGKKIIQGIVMVTLWYIWLAQNGKIFNQKRTSAVEVVNKIKSSSFFWFKHRFGCKSVDWVEWCKNPLYMT